MNDIAYILAVAALTAAILFPIFNYWLTLRRWGMFEDWKELRRAGVPRNEADRQVAEQWPWWRLR